MGTHPIFESDFDCLTGLKSECFVGGEPSSRFDIDHVVDEIESVNFVQSDIDESE